MKFCNNSAMKVFYYFIIFPFAMTSMYSDSYRLLLIFEVT